MTTWPCIDHSLLSPNGRVSKRARKAALIREAARLFAGIEVRPATPQPTERERDLRQAAELRTLAGRGMNTKSYTKQAEALEKKWRTP